MSQTADLTLNQLNPSTTSSTDSRAAGAKAESDLLQGAATFALLYVFLRGWQRDFRVPVFFSHDALEYLMQTKGTIENGWWWVHPRLSAPGTFAQVLYPSSPNVDQAIIWLLHWFSRNPAWCLNIAWMLMVVLSAVIARRCLMLLDVRPEIASPIGILYALSPYALYQQPLFCLAIYLLPVPCTVALLIAADRFGPLRRRQKVMLAIGCVLIGFNYTYYAFFACFLIVTATLIAFFRDRKAIALWRGLSVITVICLATAMNLAPSWYAWRTLGRPTVMPSKHAVESEKYGLKIRHLVGPIFNHTFPPLEKWSALERAEPFADEGEASQARLGIVATGGFVMLLAALFTSSDAAADPEKRFVVNAARLALAAVLLGTVGGFGTLFSLLVSPEIRAYSRLTPFIAFFSLFAIGLRIGRSSNGGTGAARQRMQALLALVFVLGLYDQVHATVPINSVQNPNRAEWIAVATFVHALENRVPHNGMVFQLPVLTYLNEVGTEKMLPFDHIKPYIVSEHLHWSYPALNDSVVRWQQRVGRLPPNQLAAAVAQEGFSTILIDRHGYADGGAQLLKQLAGDDRQAILVESDRYVALSVDRLPTTGLASALLPRVNIAPPASIGLLRCAATTAHYVEWIGDEAPPFPRRPVRIPSSGELFVSGWAVDTPHKTIANDIDVVVDDRPLPAFYGIDRLDVAAFLGSRDFRASGFTAKLTRNDVGSGLHTVSIRIVSADRQCFYETVPVPVISQ